MTHKSVRPSRASRTKVLIPLFFKRDSEALFPTSSSISKPLADTLKPNHTRREKGTASAPSLLENVKPVDYHFADFLQSFSIRLRRLFLRLLSLVLLAPSPHRLPLIWRQHRFHLLVGVAMDRLDLRLLLIGAQ